MSTRKKVPAAGAPESGRVATGLARHGRAPQGRLPQGRRKLSEAWKAFFIWAERTVFRAGGVGQGQVVTG